MCSLCLLCLVWHYGHIQFVQEPNKPKFVPKSVSWIAILSLIISWLICIRTHSMPATIHTRLTSWELRILSRAWMHFHVLYFRLFGSVQMQSCAVKCTVILSWLLAGPNCTLSSDASSLSLFRTNDLLAAMPHHTPVAAGFTQIRCLSSTARVQKVTKVLPKKKVAVQQVNKKGLKADVSAVWQQTTVVLF